MSTDTKTIECPCGNAAFYLFNEGDAKGFGLTVDEIATATGFKPIIHKKKGTVSWLCRDCINEARAQPNWNDLKKHIPKDKDDGRVFLVWMGKEGSEEGFINIGVYRKDGGFSGTNSDPLYKDNGRVVTHWAELPMGPHAKGDEFDGINPDDHAAALFAAARITMSPHEWEWKPEEQQAMAIYVQWASNFLPPPRRPLRCDCGCTDIAVEKDVGFDVDPGGEERQHQDHCKSCGAVRLWGDRLEGFTTRTTWWSRWEKKSRP